MTAGVVGLSGTGAPPGIPLLDPDPRRFGPVTRRLLLRLAAGLAVVQLAGAWLTFGLATERARAVGLSLTLPGGGLLYPARPAAFLVTAALVVLALVLWWGVSAHFAIPLVWVGSAAVAGALVDAPRLMLDRGTTWGWSIPVVYAAAAALPAIAWWKFERDFRGRRGQVAELNEYLFAFAPTDPAPPAREPNATDAELLRWCYDLAMQPDDGLDGLDWGEQFHGGTQLRYQLNAFCWALSLYAANYLPNATSQVTGALSKLVLEHTDLRVWRYWRTLNLLGHFDPNPDPIARDNIMFSAFLGDVLNMYEASTGATDFDEPGALTFVWKDGREFPYDHHSIVATVFANFERSRLGFFACEPGWCFTVCNTFGAQSLYGHDTLHGTDYWERYRERWLRTLEQEYLSPDGSYAHIRSNLVGLSWDTGEVPEGRYNANGTGRFSDILPAHGRRARALDMRQAVPTMGFLSAMVVDGVLPMDMPPELERHRTRSSPLPNWTKVIGGARLVGDEVLAEAAINGAEQQCATGGRWPDPPLSSSAAALAAHMIVRWSTPLGPADLNRRGYTPPCGPLLVGADDVLVVLARSSDGVSLDLVLEPSGDVPLDAVELRFEELRPSAAHLLCNDGDGVRVEVAAGADGRGSATVRVDGPTRLRLVRAAESAR